MMMMRKMSSANDICPSSQSLLLERCGKGASNRLLKDDANPSPSQRRRSSSSITANIQVSTCCMDEK